MKRIARKIFRRSASAPNTALLGEHLASIRTAAQEIRNFKEKTIFPTPTHTVQKKINIDAAWSSSRELLIEIFNVLNGIAVHFDQEPGSFIRGSGFANSLDAFIKTVDRITYGLVDAIGTGRFSAKEITAIDDRILMVQSGMNRLRKHVLEDFNYPATSVRPTTTDNYSTGETTPSPDLVID